MSFSTNDDENMCQLLWAREIVVARVRDMVTARRMTPWHPFMLLARASSAEYFHAARDVFAWIQKNWHFAVEYGLTGCDSTALDILAVLDELRDTDPIDTASLVRVVLED